MKKVKIFKSSRGSLESTEIEINDFLNDKEFVSLTQSQCAKDSFISVIFTLVYKEKNEGRISVLDL